MKRLLAMMLVLLSCGFASAEDHIPHPGIGKCPSGQVVNQLLPNAGPPNGCTSVGGGTGTVTNLPQQVNGPAITSNTTTPIITMPTNTWFAANYSGATADVKLNACLTAAATTHGTCDARGLTGTQSIVATVVLPAGTTLLTGATNYQVHTLPGVEFTGQNLLMGPISIVSGDTTNFTAVGTSAGNMLDATTLSASNISVVNILVRMLSDSDSSVGLALNASSNDWIFGNTFATMDTGIQLGGDARGTYYTNLVNNAFGGQISVAEDFGENANNDHSIGDQVRTQGGAGTYGIRFENASTADSVEGFDCEPVPTITSCLYIDGYGIYVGGAIYVAGATNAFEFGADSFGDRVFGSGNITSVTRTTLLDAGANKFTDTVDMQNISISPLYPVYVGSQNYFLSNGGSDSQYYTVSNDSLASGEFGISALFTPGDTAETQVGETGHAMLRAGNLRSTGGNTLQGLTTMSLISLGTAPTCTPTCEPSDTANCASPATTFTYAVDGQDYNGGLTGRTASTTCVNATTLITAAAQNAACAGATNPIGCCTGSGTGTCIGEFNTLTWPKTEGEGIHLWDIIGNLDLVHSVAVNHQVNIPGSMATPGASYVYVDTNNAPAPYTPATRNNTADIKPAGNIIAGSPSAGCTTATQGCINATDLQKNGVTVVTSGSKGTPFGSATVSATPATATVGCTDTTSAVASVTTSMSCIASPQGAPSGSGNVSWSCYTTAGNVNVRLCELVSIVSPAAATYNVQVFN